MTAAQVVGGPLDGTVLVIPGEGDPPVEMRVLEHEGALVMDHPSRHGPDAPVPVVVLVLVREFDPSGHPPWRYRWPASS